VPQGDLGDEVLEAGPVRKAGGRDAKVIDDGDRVRPAEGDRLVAQPDLDAGALGVAAHLLGAGLADVDDRGALQVLRGDPWAPRPTGSERTGGAEEDQKRWLAPPTFRFG
jgi:hypothetical protein